MSNKFVKHDISVTVPLQKKEMYLYSNGGTQ